MYVRIEKCIKRNNKGKYNVKYNMPLFYDQWFGQWPNEIVCTTVGQTTRNMNNMGVKWHFYFGGTCVESLETKIFFLWFNLCWTVVKNLDMRIWLHCHFLIVCHTAKLKTIFFFNFNSFSKEFCTLYTSLGQFILFCNDLTTLIAYTKLTSFNWSQSGCLSYTKHTPYFH